MASVSCQERLSRIQQVAHSGLRYLASAYRVASPNERQLLMTYMFQWANFIALIEGDHTDDRSILKARDRIIERSLLEVQRDPWTPEESTPA